MPIRDARSPSVTLGYSLNAFAIPRELTLAHSSLSEFGKQGFTKSLLLTDPQMKQLLAHFPKAGKSAEITSLINKVEYDKQILDLQLAANIDRKLIELLKEEALKIFIGHQKARKARLEHIERLRANVADELQLQDEAYLKEKEALLQQLYNSIQELDASVIKSLEDNFKQIQFLQQQIGRIEKQKEEIYHNLGNKLTTLFDKPEYKVNGKNIFEIDPRFTEEEKKSKKTEMGKIFNDNVVPLHQEITKVKAQQAQLESQHEVAKQNINEMETVVDEAKKLTKTSSAKDILSVMKGMVTQKNIPSKEEVSSSVASLFKKSHADLAALFKDDEPVPPIGATVEQPDDETTSLSDEGDGLDSEVKEIDDIMNDLEMASDSDDNKEGNAANTDEANNSPEEIEEEPVQFGPITVDQHFRNLGYRGDLLVGNIDNKTRLLIENNLKKDQLREKKENLRNKIEQVEIQIAQALSDPDGKNEIFIKAKEALLQRMQGKLDELRAETKVVNQNRNKLQEEVNSLEEKFRLNLAKIESLKTYEEEQREKIDPASAGVVEMAAMVHKALNENPDFNKTEALHLKACDDAKAACEAGIAQCGAMAAQTIAQANEARAAIAGEYQAVAGAAMAMNVNPQIQALLTNIQTVSTQTDRLKRQHAPQ